MSATMVPVRAVIPHPANIRAGLGDPAALDELAASIRAHGILQPIIVQPHPTKGGCYLILAGHRRHAAARKLGLDEVPVIVRDAADAARAVEVMLVENCQRADLSPVDKAEAMGKLLKHGYKAADIARSTGLSESTVSYYLSLLDLDKATRDRVRDGSVSVGEAVAAVRRTRRTTRRAAGKAAMGRAAVRLEPLHFAWSHPLAADAARMCKDAGHASSRLQIRKIACGQCWEDAIRADERNRATVATNGYPAAASRGG